jgi:hypothetical protein
MISLPYRSGCDRGWSRAIAILRDEGLVITIDKRGTYVNRDRPGK